MAVMAAQQTKHSMPHSCLREGMLHRKLEIASLWEVVAVNFGRNGTTQVLLENLLMLRNSFMLN